jgi:hypothetical protein
MESGKWKMEEVRRQKSEDEENLSPDFRLSTSSIFHFPFSVFRCINSYPFRW